MKGHADFDEVIKAAAFAKTAAELGEDKEVFRLRAERGEITDAEFLRLVENSVQMSTRH